MNGFVVFGVAVVLGAPVVMVDDDGWVGEWIDLCWLVMFCSVVVCVLLVPCVTIKSFCLTGMKAGSQLLRNVRLDR